MLRVRERERIGSSLRREGVEIPITFCPGVERTTETLGSLNGALLCN